MVELIAMFKRGDMTFELEEEALSLDRRYFLKAKAAIEAQRERRMEEIRQHVRMRRSALLSKYPSESAREARIAELVAKFESGKLTPEDDQEAELLDALCWRAMKAARPGDWEWQYKAWRQRY
jgi:hypothetical protein